MIFTISPLYFSTSLPFSPKIISGTERKYPTLQRIGKDILAIPVSTLASESPFSISGRLISPHHSRLHPKTMEALMCAQSWLLNEIRERKYPTLQRIAKYILVIPVSTLASESAFSISGRLISPHRSRLHPKTLEALMCAQSWLLNEIRETCSKKTEAYCRTIEFDYDVEEESTKGNGTTSFG
ncbi:zinc finger BED domain-containing protein RICESLEEPER 2-like protein [Tanacetum coccineum]